MPKAIVMAGGTGGHIFPALAVANSLRDKGWEISWLGTADRMEAELVPSHNFPIHFLPVKGLRGKGVMFKLKALFGLMSSIFSAISMMRRERPSIVLGFGGYPSGPGGVAAKICGAPLLIHEQNAVPGLTNKLLGKLATKVLVGFQQAKTVFQQKGISAEVVGNPVRSDIQPGQQQVNDSDFNLLIIGGSLGAEILNKTLPQVCKGLPPINILHQCGKGNQYAVAEAYAVEGVNAEVTDFIDDVATKYQWADAIVCRAGALTVTEVAHAGLAACFVPLPHAVDDHQTKNAKVLVDANAAVVIPQQSLPESLQATLKDWISDPQKCARMGENARDVLPHNATAQIITCCEQIIGEGA